MDKDRGRKGGRQNLKAIWRERDGGREREKERERERERENTAFSDKFQVRVGDTYILLSRQHFFYDNTGLPQDSIA